MLEVNGLKENKWKIICDAKEYLNDFRGAEAKEMSKDEIASFRGILSELEKEIKEVNSELDFAESNIES